MPRRQWLWGYNEAGRGFVNLLNRIYDLKKKKIRLMEEIYKTTVEQSKVRLPDKVDDLLAIIDRKQEQINSIDEINAELFPLEKEIANCPERTGGEESEKLFAEILAGIRILGERAQLLAEKIRKLEEQNRKMVSDEYHNLKSKIKLINQRKGSYKAYRGGIAQANGYFIDNKK